VKLKKIAELVTGEIVGSPETSVKRVATIEEAGELDMVFVLEDKYLAPALQSKASVLVTASPQKSKAKTFLVVKNPRLAMAKILPLFHPKKNSFGIHRSAIVSPTAKIGKNVTIHPFVSVGAHCEIGDETVIYPSVTIYDNVKIGKRVVIHAGARVGVDGYGFVWDKGSYVKIPQIGSVMIEDDVEIFANVCISRGTIGATKIGKGTKIDSLTHVAHNCVLGAHCAVTALVGFAGSVTLKDHVSVGGMAGFNGHITVGENSVILAKSGVTKDIPANSIVSGFPAQEHAKEMKHQASLKRLVKKTK